ncbi:larval cuticle protein LCP-14-like [Uranotaenia lowii]|uniref:larval cuticle protein LCP-14-like n=1 Tax=Uranotaenia lowii TaxID=190385 RepID=UPI00247B0556|nr:larval cuticle protein LCP-14-like [Uranotaenia lowii]
MVKFVFITFLLSVGIVLVVARPGPDDAAATIVRQEQTNNPDGSFSYEFETSNGIKANAASTDGARITGEYSYTGSDGVLYTVRYVADEMGFRPEIIRG